MSYIKAGIELELSILVEELVGKDSGSFEDKE